jgi:hypothetical protein
MIFVFGQPALAADAPPARSAQTMWMLNCQGCHRADGGGTGDAVPAMPGIVARFLWVPGGREYLIRVPGVATAPLADDSLAVLVNWMLKKFDPENIPGHFTPYTPEEVSSLRKLGAYGEEAGAIRVSLMRSFVPVASTDRLPDD